MADETIGRVGDEPGRPTWLPPRAPGGQEPPRYEPGAARREPSPEPAGDARASRWTPPTEAPEPDAPPAFVAGRGSRDVMATAALSIAVLGLGLLVLSAGLGFVITLPCSGLAWHLGRRARARADRMEARGGRRQAHVGYILGVVGVVLGLVAAVGWIVAMALGVDPQELQRDLERQADPNARQALVVAARALLGR